MTKNRRFLALSIILLVSCGETGSLGNDYPLDVTPAESEYLIERKGELLSEGITEDYAGYGTLTDASSLIERVERGETVSFLFTSSSCSKCALFEPSFVAVMAEWKADTAILMDSLDKSKAVSYFGSLINDASHPLSGATPTWYVASKEGGREIVYGANEDKQSNITAIRNGFLGNIALSNVYRFTDPVSFLSLVESDIPAFLDDPDSEEASSLKELIARRSKTSAKRLYRYDLASSLDEGKEDAIALFCDEKGDIAGHLYYQGNVYKGEEALTLLEEYCA